MKCRNAALSFVISALILCDFAMGKMQVMIDETFENCTESGAASGAFDFSKFELIAETDTAIYANGSIKFAREIKSPLKLRLFTEKFDRGQWNIMVYDKTLPNFCQSMHDPKEIMYKFFKHCPPCPYAAGVS